MLLGLQHLGFIQASAESPAILSQNVPPPIPSSPILIPKGSTSAINMLRLTPDTRERIYRLAGAGDRRLVNENVPILYSLGRLKTPAFRGSTPLKDPQPFHGLLLSCRILYAEVAALLYSENWFVVRFNAHQSLESLLALTPHAVASLTCLTAVLNQTSCNEPTDRYQGLRPSACKSVSRARGCGHVEHEGCHDARLLASSDRAKRALEEWTAAAAHLAAYVNPGQLELNLVCDVGYTEVETAKAVLDALRLLPRLRNCHLRLSGTCEPPLQELAQHAVDEVCQTYTRKRRSTNGPGLMDLPCELRLRILEYTDLVTPYREVLWSRAGGGYRVQRGPCYLFPDKGLCRVSQRQFHRGCQFTGCYQRPWPHPSLGCFCRRDHTAVSSRCRCWAPPTALFLVCRALRWDAALVFFERNSFHIVDGPHSNPNVPWPPGDYPHDTFAASQFLRRVVPTPCLSHIRVLNLAFAPFNHISKPSFSHPALRDWDETVAWAKDKLNLPRLTVRMIIPGNGPSRPEGSDGMTQAQGRETLAAYRAMVAPLRHLDGMWRGGLGDFRADLAWPLRWAKSHNTKTWSWVRARDEEVNKLAEQLVLGEGRRPGFDSRVSSDPPAYWRRDSWTWVSLRQEAYGLAEGLDIRVSFRP